MKQTVTITLDRLEELEKIESLYHYMQESARTWLIKREDEETERKQYQAWKKQQRKAQDNENKTV